jgi:hypothetical protein
MSGIARLLRVAESLSDGDPDQRWVAEAIREAIEEGGSLDEKLGIRWDQRLGTRDALIREAHQRFFPHDTPYAAAAKLAMLAKDVRKARAAGGLDQIALDDPRRLIAEAIDIGPAFPKKRQLINVLAVQ